MNKNSFIYNVADDIAKEFDYDFSNLNIIFPNKRAITFFNDSLYENIQKPFFSPNYFTISDFVNKYSRLNIADELTLIYNLYIVYIDIYYKANPVENDQAKESFDNFYYWGKMLLSDFDDLDKNLADAKILFRNIQEYKAYDSQFDFLSDDQKEVLKNFFNGFKDNPSQLNRQFVAIWNCLYDIYTEFKKRLFERGIGYSGMLYRNVVESFSHIEIDEDTKQIDRYCIIGFNVLNKVEQEIFRFIKQTYFTRFYWDYDEYYLKDQKQEAGLFMRKNLSNFPMPESYKVDVNLISTTKQDIEVIKSPSENAQIGYIKEWFSLIENQTSGDICQSDIAIILGNEALLPSVLKALPDIVGKEKIRVNITMGYEFQSTPLYGLISAYLDYQYTLKKNSNSRLVKLLPFIEHPYWSNQEGGLQAKIDKLKNDRVSYLTKGKRMELGFEDLLESKSSPKEIIEALQLIIKKVAILNIKKKKVDKNAIEEVLAEILYRINISLNRLNDIIEKSEISIDNKLFHKIILSELRSIKIPFEGDPINGVQIMGLLESRNLDFKYILMLSANDDFIPNVSGENSFIPFSIRSAYNLTTIQRKISVFAYYFYRLFHRSESLHFIYNSTSSTSKKKELSRFLQQVRIEFQSIDDYERLKQFKYKTLASKIGVPQSQDIEIKKHNTHIDKILKKEFFSASYLNTYLDCPFMFYLSKLSKVEAPDRYDDELTPIDFGNVFHHSAKSIYEELLGRIGKNTEITKEDIDQIRRDKDKIDNIVRWELQTQFLDIKKEHKELLSLNQSQYIQLEVIKRYIYNLLDMDYDYAPFIMIAMEENVIKSIDGIVAGGQIDRIDYKDGVLRVLDYKTSNPKRIDPKKAPSISELFAKENLLDMEGNEEVNDEKREGYIFQTLYYSWLLTDNTEDLKKITNLSFKSIKPELIYIKSYVKGDYSSNILIKNDINVDKGVELLDYYPYHKDFDENLRLLFQEILTINKDNELYRRRKSESNCKYCDFTTFCY